MPWQLSWHASGVAIRRTMCWWFNYIIRMLYIFVVILYFRKLQKIIGVEICNTFFLFYIRLAITSFSCFHTMKMLNIDFRSINYYRVTSSSVVCAVHLLWIVFWAHSIHSNNRHFWLALLFSFIHDERYDIIGFELRYYYFRIRKYMCGIVGCMRSPFFNAY